MQSSIDRGVTTNESIRLCTTMLLVVASPSFSDVMDGNPSAEEPTTTIEGTTITYLQVMLVKKDLTLLIYRLTY